MWHFICVFTVCQRTHLGIFILQSITCIHDNAKLTRQIIISFSLFGHKTLNEKILPVKEIFLLFSMVAKSKRKGISKLLHIRIVCLKVASLMVPNGNPQDEYFYPILTRIMDSFFLTIEFKRDVTHTQCRTLGTYLSESLCCKGPAKGPTQHLNTMLLLPSLSLDDNFINDSVSDHMICSLARDCLVSISLETSIRFHSWPKKW